MEGYQSPAGGENIVVAGDVHLREIVVGRLDNMSWELCCYLFSVKIRNVTESFARLFMSTDNCPFLEIHDTSKNKLPCIGSNCETLSGKMKILRTQLLFFFPVESHEKE